METTLHLPETVKDLKVRMSLFEQEERYMAEEIQRITLQNKLMARDKKELAYHKEQLESRK